jgi:acyl-CoA thioester hydrolase
MSQAFRHNAFIEVRFVDIDMYGIVNNANYLTYFEQARISYFDNIIGGDVDWTTTGVVVAKVSVEYKKPIAYRDKVVIKTAISKIGSKSFEVVYSVVKLIGDKEIECAIGSNLIVCYNHKINQTINIPENWKSKMIAFDNPFID